MNCPPPYRRGLRLLRQVVAGSALVLTTGGAVQALSIKAGDLAPFEVIYEVGNNLITAGSARLVLTNDGELWNYSLNTRPRGVFKLVGKGRISETSTFKAVESDGAISLQTQTYQYRQDKEHRRAVDAIYNWNKNIITHTYRGNTVTDTFSQPTFDRLTVTLVIMNALRNDFKSEELMVFDTGDVEAVAFINDGTETLDTPIGDIETIRVINRKAAGSSRETVTWFAPSLDYLPVKIEHKKRGELVARLSLVKLANRVTNIELGEALPLDEDAELDAVKDLIGR